MATATRKKRKAKIRKPSSKIDPDAIPEEVAAVAESEAAYIDHVENHPSPDCRIYGHQRRERERYQMTDEMDLVHVVCRRRSCPYGYWLDEDRETKEVVWKSAPHYGSVGYLKPPAAKLARPGRIPRSVWKAYHTPEARPASSAPNLAADAFAARWGEVG